MVSCVHFLTQDDAKQLECVIGYATSLYLVMEQIQDSPHVRSIFKEWQPYILPTF